jgi:type III secretion protein C
MSMARWLRRVTAVCLCSLLTATAVQAADVPWRKEKFSYMTRGQSLRDFLRHFGASQGLTVVVDPAVEGSVVGSYNMTPPSVLDMLSVQHGLIWYYDGNILYVYPAGQAQNQTVRLNYGTVAQFKQQLARLNVPDKRYPIKYDAQTNTALVGGPKRYVELINEIAQSLDQKEGSSGTTDIQVFPLKYAWAEDKVFSQGGREHRLPGVATVLRNLYRSNGASALSMGAAGARSNPTVDRLERMGLMAKEPGSAKAGAPNGREPIEIAVGNSLTPGGIAAAQQGLPQFQADGRLNAVVVRDTPERMAFYERVIRQLDIRPSLVEIEARIIEISSDKAKSLGVDWRVQTPRFDVQSGMSPLNGNSVLGAVGSLPAVAGGVFATRLADAGRQLLARVNALAKTGHANVLSSPRIMTLDNVEAVIENLNEFFVRVAGNLDANLFNVSSGTSLRVTPLIVPEGDQILIKMAIKIEDGTLSNQTVDAIPVVRRTNIGTQAFIANGESLLIAGFSQITDSSAQAGVPGVSSVPVFGRLFRYDETRTQRVERMFLLTPRVVQLPGGPGS